MNQFATTFDESVDWLQRRSTAMIRASHREMADGTAAFPPQVATHYEAFWLRDYAYILAGDPDAFSHDEQIAACRLFVSKQRDDGAMVDCIKFDGTPIYQPGYGTMGENPVADGSQFAVDVAWHTFQNTRNFTLLKEILDALIRGLNAVPRSARGLVWIDPDGWDRCPYGFTDSIRKTGEVLFCSLLLVQAQRQIADLLDAVSRDGEAASWRAASERVAENVRAVFWDEESQLFLAATRDCRQVDIWGSVFAAFLGVADESQKRAIREYSRTHYGDLVWHGQLRHLPRGAYWNKTATPREEYQNGAYWATPIGWFVAVLRDADVALAEKTIVDLVRDFQAHGVYECISGRESGTRNGNVEGYLASVALPLEVLRHWPR